jgi:DNA-binding transcriptional LysR family regulator
MPRVLPSTRALQIFSAVARHQNVSAAAEELSLTHSALSQQLHKLEEQLGVQLLLRSSRGVSLTEAGRHYREQVDADLERLQAHMLETMARREGESPLVIGAVPVLAERWLVPRLPGFLAQHPQVSLQLKVFPHMVFVEDPRFDAAIHYQDAAWSGARREPLMDEDCVAVCSPHAGVAKRLAGGDFRSVPLLHLTSRPDAWQQWFAQARGVRAPANPLAGHRLDLFSLLLEAVRAGIGAGMVPRYFVERELASGELVLAHRHVLEATQSYALLVPERRAADPLVLAFAQWLREQARAGA